MKKEHFILGNKTFTPEANGTLTNLGLNGVIVCPADSYNQLSEVEEAHLIKLVVEHRHLIAPKESIKVTKGVDYVIHFIENPVSVDSNVANVLFIEPRK